MAARADWLAALAVLLAVAFSYREMLFQGLVLGDYDAFVYFYPLRQYAAELLRQGQFPLWNPYLFLGSPFFANVQTAVLYPLNLLFLILPTPFAFSASVVIHVALAAESMYLFSRRSLEVGPIPSIIAAMAFSLSGFMSSQVGHINQLNVSAWLPALLLVFDEAVKRRSPALAIVTGLIGASQLLAGHTQEWYFSTVVLGLFGLWKMAVPPAGLSWRVWKKSLFGLLRPFSYLLIAGAVEAGITAVQVLPTLELSQYSIRGGGMSYGEAASFSLPPTTALYSLLPRYPSTLFGEYTGYIGVTAVVMAVFAVFGWWRRPITLFMVLLAAFGLFMAIGGYNPFFPALYHHMPGVDLFRVPARWLLVYSFAACCLAGLGAQLALDVAGLPRIPMTSRPGEFSRVRYFRFVVSAIVVASAMGLLALLYQVAQPRPEAREILTWLAISGVAVLLLALAGLSRRIGGASLGILALVLLGELSFAGGEMDYRHPIPFEGYRPERTSTSTILEDASQYVDPGRLLSLATDRYEVKETPDYKKDYAWLSQESLRQFLVAVKLSEALAPNVPMEYGIQTADGYDGGVLPLRRYGEFKSTLFPNQSVPADNPLRTHLTFVPPSWFLDLASVRYILSTKIQDTQIDNVYYDRGISIELGPGQVEIIVPQSPVRATSIGIISSTEGARELPDETQAGALVVSGTSGVGYSIPVRLGVETGETPENDAQQAPAAHRKPQAVQPWSPEFKSTDYFAKIPLPSGMEVKRITLQGLVPTGKMRIRAITLIDDVAANSVPLVLAANLDRQLFFDMKLYTNRSPLPRAHLAYSSTVRDDEAALELLKQGSFDVRDSVLLAPSATARSIYYSSPQMGGENAARITSYHPEQVVAEVSAARGGYLVLQDAYYPGWIATVDGNQVPIERANHFFRAVYVEPGSHTVVFQYSPSSFRVGLWISLLSGGLVILALIWLRVGRRTPSSVV